MVNRFRNSCKKVALTGIIQSATASVKVGQTVTLTATPIPANANDYVFEWTSNNANCRIEPFDLTHTYVRGVTVGSSVVTVKDINSGITKTTTVTVTA